MPRNRMPDERQSLTHRFTVGPLKGYITVGLYPDGAPGEVFLTVQQVGSFERGMSHVVALLISVALQHGVPLEKLVEKLKGVAFEPAGVTNDPEIPMVRSLADYVARWLEKMFMLSGKGECGNSHDD